MNLQYQLNSRLGGCQSWSGHFGEEKILFSPARNRICDHPVPTEMAEWDDMNLVSPAEVKASKVPGNN
jgi:hypothetical protein